MSEKQQKQNKSSAIDALLMVALVFSLFTMLCLITRSALLGEVGEVYSTFVLGAIGFVAYGIMPLIACYSIFQLFAKKSINSLVIVLSVALYVLGLSLIFHILTSSSAEVFAGEMEYYQYVNESFYLQADGVYGATAGGAVCSAILFYIIQSVGIVGANIFSVLIIALATLGLWLVIRKMMPHKAKAPKVKKAKKIKREKITTENSEVEYPEYDPRESEEYFQEKQQAPQKQYNALGFEVINPSETTQYQNSQPQNAENPIFAEKPSKMHIVNIDEVSTQGKRKKKATPQDILFNGVTSDDRTVANHNRVRQLGGEDGEDFQEPAISINQNQQMMDIFSNYKPAQTTQKHPLFQDSTNDYRIKPTSEFGIVDSSVKAEETNEIPTPFVQSEEETKAMYKKQMPKVPPKIWTMADLEAEKAAAKTENSEIAEDAEEAIVEVKLSEAELLEIAEREEKERREKLKADLMSPADSSDMEKLQNIYPQVKNDSKEVINPRIITSISQLEEKTQEAPQQPSYTPLARPDLEYDARTDEFVDKGSLSQEEPTTPPVIKEVTPFEVVSDIGTAQVEEIESFGYQKSSSEEIIQDSYQNSIGFGKTEFSTSTPDEVYTRQNISNPIVITNPDGKRGEQLPIYAETEEKITFERPYIYPPIDLLEEIENQGGVDLADVEENARLLETVLANFGIPAKVMDTIIGPTVTKYELEMPQGIQVKRVEGFSRDISMTLESPSEVIIEAPIPGKNRVGIEVPNKIKQVVSLKEVIASSEFTVAKSKTVFALGKDVTGKNILCDIKDMPHLLIAGATGMGKSVCLNTLIMSLIYHSDPSDLRMLLIDPKKVEFISYKGIPHLLINEIISDNDKAILALGWAIDEMEKRYTMFESVKQKDMDSYNATIMAKGGKKLPRIVIVVDEVADLMSVNKKEIEGKIQRLTQKARAAGIHLVLATQRPSVDVITGVIKTNLPSRIAFKLSNGIDSKTVIDEGGAERLLGRGDMFYRPASWPAKVRVQGCFVSTPEVDKVIDFVIAHNSCKYDELCYNAIYNPNKKSSDYDGGGDDFEVDENFKKAVHLAIEQNNITITAIQRRFGLGFPRAGKILDAMLARGYVADTMNGKTREVLIDAEGFEREFGEPF
ncbi:MAG: DNA translocase FtsK [Bacillota bacterium]